MPPTFVFFSFIVSYKTVQFLAIGNGFLFLLLSPVSFRALYEEHTTSTAGSNVFSTFNFVLSLYFLGT